MRKMIFFCILMSRVCGGSEKTSRWNANKNVLGIVSVNLMLTLIQLLGG